MTESERPDIGYISKTSNRMLKVKVGDAVGFVSITSVVDVIDDAKDYCRIFRSGAEFVDSSEAYKNIMTDTRNKLTELGIKLSQKEITFEEFSESKARIIGEKNKKIKEMKERKK